MIVEVKGEIIVFGNGKAAIGGAALIGERPFDWLPPDAIGEMLAEQDDPKDKDTQAGRFTVKGGYDDNHGEVNEVQGKDRDAAIYGGGPAGGPRSPESKDNCIRIDADGLTLSRVSPRIPDEDETPLYIPTEDDRRATTPSGTPAAPFG
jgi:hypothetical protein